MAVNGIELQAGQQWRNGAGTVVTITGTNAGDPAYPWLAKDSVSGYECYTADGRYLGSGVVSEYDLVELLNPPPNSEAPAPVPVPVPTAEPGLAINPKDAIGSSKLPLHLWPAEATAMGCLGMLEGAEKYGRNNFIAGDGVIASIYVDAAKRHLDAWFAGEECSHDVGGPHLGNALATIGILVKAQAHGKLIDDRDYSPRPNGSAYRAFVETLTPYVGRIKSMFADKKPRHYTIADVGGAK